MPQDFGDPRKPGRPGSQNVPQGKPGWRDPNPQANLRPGQQQPARPVKGQPPPTQPNWPPPPQRPPQQPQTEWQSQQRQNPPQQYPPQQYPPQQYPPQQYAQQQGQMPPQGYPQQGQMPQQYSEQQWDEEGNAYGDGQNEQAEEPSAHKVDPSKRIIALMFDTVACWLVAIITVMVPFVKDFVTLNIMMALLLLTRDFLFGGRGIGKNFMGLRVVDARTGGAPSLFQCFLRNIILLAPFLVLQIVGTLLKFVPSNSVSETVMTLINIIGTVYCIIVLPLESYRAYSRPDSLRKGDELAHTTIVEAPMDFSNPFAR